MTTIIRKDLLTQMPMQCFVPNDGQTEAELIAEVSLKYQKRYREEPPELYCWTNSDGKTWVAYQTPVIVGKP